MQRIIKIGNNRNKARLWLEGKCLEQMGWKRGDVFACSFGNGRVIYTRLTKHPDGQGRRVAGTDQRPVIDTNTDKILEAVGDFRHVVVHIEKNRIMFVGTAHEPTSAIAKAMKTALVVASAIAAPFISQFKPDAMRVLVGCEESATVRNAFLEMGHDAVSCDLMDTRDPSGWHIKDDILKHIDGDWDLALFFPPCDFLTNSAAWAFNDPNYDKYPEIGYHQRVKDGTLVGQERREAREEAIAFFLELYHSRTERVCMENPVGSMSKAFRKPDQIIQPHQFGHAESKSTCLWLKNLPLLQSTNVLDIEVAGYATTNGHRWLNQTPSGQSKLPPSADRNKIRSTTYAGIAKAMASQWG